MSYYGERYGLGDMFVIPQFLSTNGSKRMNFGQFPQDSNLQPLRHLVTAQYEHVTSWSPFIDVIIRPIAVTDAMPSLS